MFVIKYLSKNNAEMWLDHKTFNLIQVLIGHSLGLSNRGEWVNEQNSSHDPARVRHVSELGQVDTWEVKQKEVSPTLICFPRYLDLV